MQGRKERDECIIGLWSRENRREEVVVRERERERGGGGGGESLSCFIQLKIIFKSS